MPGPKLGPSKPKLGPSKPHPNPKFDFKKWTPILEHFYGAAQYENQEEKSGKIKSFGKIGKVVYGPLPDEVVAFGLDKVEFSDPPGKPKVTSLGPHKVKYGPGGKVMAIGIKPVPPKIG